VRPHCASWSVEGASDGRRRREGDRVRARVLGRRCSVTARHSRGGQEAKRRKGRVAAVHYVEAHDPGETVQTACGVRVDVSLTVTDRTEISCARCLTALHKRALERRKKYGTGRAV
jgi:hypothetical protein